LRKPGRAATYSGQDSCRSRTQHQYFRFKLRGHVPCGMRPALVSLLFCAQSPEVSQISAVIQAPILIADIGVNGIEQCFLRIGRLDVLVLQIVKRHLGDLGNIIVMRRVETVKLRDRE
jgi:hypothetical protein